MTASTSSITATGSERVTVVCPVFNEEEGLEEFHRRLDSALSTIAPRIDYEILFVNDGSSDNTAAVLQALAEANPRVGVIGLSRNFGHQLAITAGIDASHGDAVVLIDSDLQDPPEVIAGMVQLWREGYDVVYGQRTLRPGESRFKLATAHAFYRVINWMADISLPTDAGDFRLMSRRVVQALQGIREESRYVRGLVAWVGFRQTALPYERDLRHAGETKYPLRKMLRFATDGMSSFSEKPLRMATQLGLSITAVAFVLAAYIVTQKFLDPQSQLPGYASTMAVVLLLGGIQLLSIGILGQYIGRIYREVKRRPLYIIGEATNVRGPIDPLPRPSVDPPTVVAMTRDAPRDQSAVSNT